MINQILKRVWRWQAPLTLLLVSIISLLFCSSVENNEPVTRAKLEQLQIGMSKHEVRQLLGNPLEEKCLKEGWLSQFHSSSQDPRYILNWSKPGGLTYSCATRRQGAVWSHWVSSSLCIGIRFNKDDCIEDYWSAPAHVDTEFSESNFERFKRWSQYQFKRLVK